MIAATIKALVLILLALVAFAVIAGLLMANADWLRPILAGIFGGK